MYSAEYFYSSEYAIEMAYIDIYERCATRGGGR